MSEPQPASPHDESLLRDFITEAAEHLDTADQQLLILEANPEDVEALNAVYRSFHTLKSMAGFMGLEDVRSLAHETETLFECVQRHEMALEGKAIDAAFHAIDSLKKFIRDVQRMESSGRTLHGAEDLPELLEKLRSASPAQADSDDTQDAADHEKAKGSMDTVADYEMPRQDSLYEALVTKPDEGTAQVRDDAIKVDAEKLERLVEAIGELVVVESVLRHSPELTGVFSFRFSRHVEAMQRITDDLRSIADTLRMVPLKPMFQRLARVIRDTAKKDGKSVDFSMSGEDIELDKAVADSLWDPLVHLVRNAVAHGIEHSAKARQIAGKPETGLVALHAHANGQHVLIEVKDDGRGLDRDAIVDKAMARGMIDDRASLTDEEVWSLIFDPGLSTIPTVTDLAGRGMGMDIVKRNIEALGGSLGIRSAAGRGCTFMLRLPYSLQTVPAAVVRNKEDYLVIHEDAVVNSYTPASEDFQSAEDGRQTLLWNGYTIPYMRLNHLVVGEQPAHASENGLVVVVESNSQCIALAIDEWIGRQQVVIRTLGEVLRDLPGVSAGARMTGGDMGLVLDVGELVKLGYSDKSLQDRQIPEEGGQAAWTQNTKS